MTTYQTRLCLTTIKDFEMGVQVAEEEPIFVSQESENIKEVFHELQTHEPDHNDWFAVLVIKDDGKIVEEELFDSSVMEFE